MEKIEQLNDLDTVLQSFINIGSRLDGIKILPEQEFLYNAEGLGMKILNHAISARVLYNGYQYNNFQPNVDFGSIAVLTRSAFENYLAFNYLFISAKNEDEAEFRLQAWHLGGLDRIKYKPAFESNIKKWDKEVAMSETIKERIKSTDFFRQQNEKRKKDIMNGNWKIDGWFKLARDANFNEVFFRKQYMFLCGHAHSNRLSVIQTQQINTIEAQQDMAIACIGILTVVVAKFAFDYVQLMPGLKQNIDLNSEEFSTILQYKNIGELLY